MPNLPAGKLRAEALRALFDKFRPLDARVVVGPKIGEDAAVLEMGDRYLVATTDPITFATEEIGWYALQVNANDVAVRGARPRWFLATLLLPEGATTDEAVEQIFSQVGRACEELEVSLVGGHTEVTHGLTRPIVVGTMLGEVEKDRLVTTGGARPGDVLLLTKSIPLEGAAILAREKGDALLERGVPQAFIERARQFLHRPGISVVPEALLAGELAAVHSMHDPTEGGLATGLWELALASEVGLRVERERIPVLPEGERFCRALGLDPLGTIASGSLLLSLAPADAARVLHACAREGIDCAFIGQVVPRAEGVTLVEDGRERPMPVFPRDEIARLF
jgi:hydrogenase maturation factor